MSKKRDSFVFYRSFYESIKELPDKQQLEIFQSIVEYGLNNETPDGVDVVAKAIFTLIKPQLDANTKRYLNGRKGGAPRGNNNASKDNKQPKTTKKQPKNNLKQPKAFEKQPNVNVNDNGNGNGNVNDNVNDNVNKNENENENEGEQEKKSSPTIQDLKNKAKSVLDVKDDLNDYDKNIQSLLEVDSILPSQYLALEFYNTMDDEYRKFWNSKNGLGKQLRDTLSPNDVQGFIDSFNDKVLEEGTPYNRRLIHRLNRFTRHWLNNNKKEKTKGFKSNSNPVPPPKYFS